MPANSIPFTAGCRAGLRDVPVGTGPAPDTGRPRRRAAAALAILLGLGCSGDDPVVLPQPMSSNPPVEYPVELWDANIEGETILLIHVDAEGLVASVEVDESSGSPRLDSAAVQGGRELRFMPGRKGDRRVGAWVRLPVRFRRDSVQVGPVR